MDTVTGFIIACLASIAYGAPSSQIIGLDVVDTYPYHASLRIGKDNPIIPHTGFCGGAIISQRFVITTAQCLLPRISNPYQVYVAYGNKYFNESILVRAATLIVHAGYNAKLHINDIGLIRVEADIKFNENTQPIKLPTADRNYDFYPFVVTGWRKSSKSYLMQEIIVQGFLMDICNLYVRLDMKDHTHICTISDKDETICIGDKGNPLVTDDVLVGLISFNNDECHHDEPIVSTRVFYYRAWINFYTGI